MWKELKAFGGADARQSPVWWGGYVLGFLLAWAALGVRMGLDAWLDHHDVWTFFFLGVAVAAWWLGWKPGAVAAGAGLVLGLYFVVPPRHTWLVKHLVDWVGLLTYVVVTAVLLAVARLAQRQQERLREAKRCLAGELDFSQAVVDSLPGLFYMLDGEGRLRRWNKLQEEVSGYSAAELEGKPGLEMVAPEERELTAEKMREALASGQSQAELYLLTRDGRRLPYFFTGRRFTHAGRTGLVGMGVDIAERKRAEMALRKQNHRLAVLQEAAVRLLSNPEPERVLSELLEQIGRDSEADLFLEFGLSRDEGVLVLRASGGLDEAARRRLARLEFGQAICGTVAETRQPVVRAHIQESEEPMVQPLRGLGVRACACTPLLVGERLHGTLAFASRRKDSFEEEDLRFFQTLAGSVALARERAELMERLREYTGGLEHRVEERTAQLREAVANMEQMSYSMIHDLRAPLRAIESFGGILAAQAAAHLDARGQELVEKMRTAARRMDHLVRDALNYSLIVREELPLQAVEVGALVRGMVATYPDFQPPKAAVEVAPELPRVIGNEAALTQCFSQLLDNAVKFAKPGRQAHVKVWGEEKQGQGRGARGEGRESLAASMRRAEIPYVPGEAESGVLSPHAAFIRLWVEDDGVGIDREAQATLFKLFQRLSTEGKGTGMGLAIVKKAVERMGGRVGVESELGVGSRFWVELRKG